MGSLGTMVDDMAEVLGMPAVTLGSYAKELRVAGMIRTSGRGPSAAAMTESDFASLMVAALTQPQIAHCADRTKEVRQLPFAKRTIFLRDASFAGGKDPVEIASAFSPLDAVGLVDFGAAVETVLSAAEQRMSKGKLWHPVHTQGATFRIALTTPGDIAVVEQQVHGAYSIRHIFTAEHVARLGADVSIYDWQMSRAKTATFDIRAFGGAVVETAVVSMHKPVRQGPRGRRASNTTKGRK